MKKLFLNDVNHYIMGAKVLACGGGGSESTARNRVKEIYENDSYFQMMTLDEIPDDELIFIVGSVGGGVSVAAQKAVAKLPQIMTDLYVEAAQRLAEHLGREPFGFIATEIGPGNGVVPMYVAAKMGKVFIDGDCCGRAKPEIAISTTNLAGLSITPLSMVSPFGDFLILKAAVDDARAEVIARHVAIASGGTVGVARCPASGSDYRRSAIDGSVTRCIQLGQAMSEAYADEMDVVKRILTVTRGINLFSGEITQVQIKDEGGFTTGNLELKGSIQAGKKQGHEGTLRIWFKNEYLAAWFEKNPLASSPDSICVVDATTGNGVAINEIELKPKRNIVVFGIPSAPQWRTEKGIKLFGPSHFQLPMEYTPIEDQ
ncbi:MAG: DUF917 domain-containing protein [Candidatus Hermodarchaeia archaeon]|jgi:DUF917 family protein